MALSTKGELKTTVADWLRRTGNTSFTGSLNDCIALAEARLNRELGPVETSATRTGTVDSNAINVSSLAIVQAMAMWISDPGSFDEKPLQQQSAGNVSAIGSSGRPAIWFVDSVSTIKFERPCDQAYGFRLRFRQKFELAADGDTNWLLDEHPDIYLAATITWGALRLGAVDVGATWASVLKDGMPSLKNVIAATHRSTLRTDPALAAMGGGRRA